MRKINRIMLPGIALLGFLAFALANPAFALHDGGVGHCDACHTMHNSADNPVGPGVTPNSLLLKGSDPSSTCLNCHNGSGGYHIKSLLGTNTNQGGDFFWMVKDYTVTIRGNVVTYGKDDHGHNVVASDFTMLADQDPDNQAAPGGSYLAINLSCTSCHDPHGKVAGGTANGGFPISVSGSYGAADPTDGSIHGNYRLLGDSDYVAPGGHAFTADAPIARSKNVSGGSYGAIGDYGMGMSEWCGNCHPDYLIGEKHPSGNGKTLGNDIANNYNQYVKTGDMGGNQLTSFDGLVPFERGVADGSLLSDAPVVGPTSNSNVMCLTCHRAHASANANAGKWDFEVELIAESHALASPDVDATAAVYYKDGVVIDPATEYGEWQRSLCNKCHVQD
jgi:hypothetical protein